MSSLSGTKGSLNAMICRLMRMSQAAISAQDEMRAHRTARESPAANTEAQSSAVADAAGAMSVRQATHPVKSMVAEKRIHCWRVVRSQINSQIPRT